MWGKIPGPRFLCTVRLTCLLSTTPCLRVLVAVAPDGCLAAFCVGWLDKDAEEKPSGQIEPLGVHDDFRRLGLGRAILSEGLRRLYLCGADRVYVETDKHGNAALELYEAVGLRVIQDVLVYRKDYGDVQG